MSGVDHDRAEDFLGKIKALFFAVWEGTGYITSKQVAQFYEVAEHNISVNYQRNLPEFESDGAKVVTGSDLKQVKHSLCISSKAPHLAIYPPRAVMRMGFVLTNSRVAEEVRNAALNAIEQIPHITRQVSQPAPQSDDLTEKLRLIVTALEYTQVEKQSQRASIEQLQIGHQVLRQQIGAIVSCPQRLSQ